jgi:hypothetical protein
LLDLQTATITLSLDLIPNPSARLDSAMPISKSTSRKSRKNEINYDKLEPRKLLASDAGTSHDAALVNEVLLQELVVKQPRLIAGPNHFAIDNQSDSEAIESKRKRINNNQNQED